MSLIADYLTLCRVPVALFTASATATGFLIAAPHARGLAQTAAAVFLLACGASALNQWQERDIDSRMERTRNRPLPAGRMTRRRALAVSVLAVLAGLALLLTQGVTPAFFGAIAVLWYNFLYTPLKRRTAFAAVYGAPSGMIAPIIGWNAAGGSLGDPRILPLAMLFALWQVPHFWLLLLRESDAYGAAGLPSLTALLPRDRIARLIAVWTLAAASASLALPLFGLVRSLYFAAVLVIVAVSATGIVAGFAMRQESPAGAFRVINTFLATVMIILVADALTVR